MIPSSCQTTERPSLIAVTSEVPWPLDSGGHLRTYHLLRTLARQGDVRLIVPSIGDGPAGAADALGRAGLDLCPVAVRPRTRIGETAKALLASARREPYVLFGRHRHQAVRRTLHAETRRRRPDLLYLDHLDSLLYADAQPEVPVIVDMHNVYSQLALRAAAEATGEVRRRYLAHQAALIATMERRAASVAHTILAVSHEDAGYFGGLGARRVIVVPNGVDCAAYADAPCGRRSGQPTILYVGSLAWPPNANAALFLAADVLPRVRRSVPAARLTIVGREPTPELLAIARDDDHVEIKSGVADVAPYFRSAHLLAVPLQSGGGTRLKILEAFAAGLPVVSTALGCEGLGTVPGRHLLVSDRAVFADAVVDVLLGPEPAAERASRARALARERYDWSVVGARACEAVAQAAARREWEPAASRSVATEGSIAAP